MAAGVDGVTSLEETSPLSIEGAASADEIPAWVRVGEDPMAPICGMANVVCIEVVLISAAHQMTALGTEVEAGVDVSKRGGAS